MRLPRGDIHDRRALRDLSRSKRRIPGLIPDSPKVPILTIPTPIANPIIINEKTSILAGGDTDHILILKSGNSSRRFNIAFLRDPALEVAVLAPGPDLALAINNNNMAIPTGDVSDFLVEPVNRSSLPRVTGI